MLLFSSFYPLLTTLLWLVLVSIDFAGYSPDERRLVDQVNGMEYVPTYEDKEGDWMLVGDVPWKYVFLILPLFTD